jgi:NAD(P)-dependent dehydrogenase (short-subunit alcohol dehydrogenase family)
MVSLTLLVAVVPAYFILALSFFAGGWIAPLISWIGGGGYSFSAIPNLAGQVAIVTGSNTGIGYVTARELARKGATVVVAARSAEKGNEAVAKITKAIQNVKGAGSAVFMPLDLNSFQQVRKFASNFRGKFSRLDMLVLNAGVWPNKYSTTADGYEQTMGVNHLAHFLLVKVLMPLIRLSKCRVVTVSSALEKQSYKDVSTTSPVWLSLHFFVHTF